MKSEMLSIILTAFILRFVVGGPLQQLFEPEAFSQPAPYIRDLKTGQLNFLHTTDTHGWLGSHLLQPNYNADWGDFVTFVSEFKEKQLNQDQDFLLIDTGDKHDGNGLSDATVPNGIETTKIFNEQDYDLLTLGNHELYTPENTLLEYYSTVLSPKFADKYISSNVEFVKKDGSKVPFGNKYRYFETKNTRARVLAFSFLFDFRRFNERAVVTPALEELKKPWFHDVTARYHEEFVDLILVFGHMPVTDVQNREINRLHDLLRRIYPNTVIQYFGGHSHIRDFVELDKKSTALQSGRFAETVGFLSIDNLTGGSPKFFRRYMDFSTRSFAHHLSMKHMPKTEKGLHVTSMIKGLRQELQLDAKLGSVPRTYYMSSKPLKSPENLYHLITHEVLPRLHSQFTNQSMSRFILMNTGAVRYDLFKGPFTQDTEFIVLPFSNEWLYLELPLRIASKVMNYLNKGPAIASLAPPQAAAASTKVPAVATKECPKIKEPNLTFGLTTADDYGCDGDDVPHNTLDDYELPNVVQSEELVSDDPDDIVHFVFYSFLKPHVLDAVNALTKAAKNHKQYDESDCKQYGGASTKKLLRDFIQQVN
ncbi:related to 5^ nucleotidase [Zygosaccharomyces bailii]|nr:related to 5^ nucleotidase [Zygosaccharomyces bailii]